MSKILSKPLAGIKIAILVANGFQEKDLTVIQRGLLDLGANMRIVSSENGLVNSWNGDGWGHHYAIDTPLASALGADYAMLVIPGGARSVDKLKLTAHTKRFIGGFIAAGKPVAVCGDALPILIYTETVSGHGVAGPAELELAVTQAGGSWQGSDVWFDGHLMTGVCDDAARLSFAAKLVDSFISYATISQAA